ncbi:MAG TPA: hypothetical protein PKH79_14810 [Prolixibacteraceae bacterium]|nr:hypothetical protein [Prolixibacteraceae bacterium]
MSLSRKDFFKTVCLGGACLCGFGPVALAATSSPDPSSDQDNKMQLFKEWIEMILSNIDSSLSEKEVRSIIKSCALAHYNQLKMDDVLAGYQGNLDKFIGWLETSWGWKVTHDRETKTIVADENKNYCVCPMINHAEGKKYPALCYCSEGFAEKMFSTVIGSSVSATTVSSVQRGDASCKYQIIYK